MRKAYFQYYESFENIALKIKDPIQREHFRGVIISYGLHGTEPDELTDLEDMAWGIVKELIDQQKNRREINAGNRAKKTAPAGTETPADKEPMTAEQTEKPEKKDRFQKPTREEVEAYCKEKGYNINIGAFYSYYESNGWKIGRSPMKNWRATIQSWHARDKANGTIWNNGTTDANTKAYEGIF